MTLTIILYGCIAAAAELLGGALVVMRKAWPGRVQEYLLALSAGFILALVFLELVPESLRAMGPEAPLFMLLGYSVLHFFEHTLVGHLHFGEETHRDIMVSRVASLSTFAGLMVHAFFDGFAISVGMQFNFTLGLLIFLAVLLHKIPEGLTSTAAARLFWPRWRLPLRRCWGSWVPFPLRESAGGCWGWRSHSRPEWRRTWERAI
jgi:zinc transporter ZupT